MDSPPFLSAYVPHWKHPQFRENDEDRPASKVLELRGITEKMMLTPTLMEFYKSL
jgi:hypothetical protein